jgi:hypothetical protein
MRAQHGGRTMGPTATGEVAPVSSTSSRPDRAVQTRDWTRAPATRRAGPIARLATGLAVWAAVCAWPASVARAAPGELVEAFLGAVTRGDVPGAVALLDQDAVYEGLWVCSPTPCVGRDAIGAALAYETDDATAYRLWSALDESDGDVTAAGEMTCRSLQSLAPRIVYTLRSAVGPTGITALRLVPDRADPPTRRVLTSLAAVRDALDEARALGDGGAVTFAASGPP